jgi:hypothetical protein
MGVWKAAVWALASMSLMSAAAPVGQPSNGGPSGGSSVGGLAAAAPAGTVFVIHLEQKKEDKTVAMFPTHVFDAGDVVRFRVTAKGFGGYLYVVDLGSSGTYSTLYPSGGSGAAKLLRTDEDAFVPAVEDGWFQVDGPAGFDVLYFLVSPKPIDVAPGPGGKAPSAPVPDSLKPRCDDKIFQARGECVDDSAGPAALSRDVPLPPQFTNAAGNASRDIVFDQGDEDHAVTATAPLDKPAVYIFRLAHR